MKYIIKRKLCDIVKVFEFEGPQDYIGQLPPSGAIVYTYLNGYSPLIFPNHIGSV